MDEIGKERVEKTYNEEFDAAVESIINDIKVPNSYSSQDEHKSEMCALANFVKAAFEKSSAARAEIEDRWMDSLRLYKGVYTSEALSKMSPNRCKAFVKLTRTKVSTLDSRLSDLLFPANGDKNWGIYPTPLPDYNPKYTEAIIALYKEETGQDISKADLDVMLQKEAISQAKKMERVIADQLAELNEREKMRYVIHSGNLYGTGIIKGPLVTVTENRQYYRESIKNDDGEEGKWILEEVDTLTPFIENVRVWDIYPDMDATNIQDARYVVQRRKMDKHQILGLAKRSDFDSEVILDYVACNPDGDYTNRTFEVTLTSMGNIVTTSVPTIYDTKNTKNVGTNSKKYEVLEYWGYVDACDLEAIGIEIPENKKSAVEVAANVWVLGDKIIKASLSPLEGIKWPYFFYYYDKDETSIFGEGIPYVLKDVQEMINSALRAMLDNAAISAGPQIEVNLNLMSEDEDPRDVFPFKVWMRTGDGADASAPAIRHLNFQSYLPEFERMIEMLHGYADEVSLIPRYMWGEPTGNAARTASGLSMLMGSANISIKDQVKSFDDGITSPLIKAMYHWNMQFNDDEDIKGDYGVIARGSSSLIAKEVRAEKLISFAQISANAMDAEFVNRAELIRRIADSLDLSDDNLVYSDQEIEAKRQAAQEAAEAERMWMSEMVEIARESGQSPTALLDSLRLLRKELANPPMGMEEDIQAAEESMIEQEMNGAQYA